MNRQVEKEPNLPRSQFLKHLPTYVGCSMVVFGTRGMMLAAKRDQANKTPSEPVKFVPETFLAAVGTFLISKGSPLRSNDETRREFILRRLAWAGSITGGALSTIRQ